MPEAVERCVQSLLSHWKKDPASKPRKLKPNQTDEDQAWAICTAAYQKRLKQSLDAMFEEGGYGPTLLGAAATNRPFISGLKQTQVVEKEIDGEVRPVFIVHLARAGSFMHPWVGIFKFDRMIWANMIANFYGNVTGSEICYDSSHLPQHGALGWFQDLWIENERDLYGLVIPTPLGLETIKGNYFKYSSMEWTPNYKRTDIELTFEQATEDFCVALEESAMDTEYEKIVQELEAKLSAREEELHSLAEERQRLSDMVLMLERRAIEDKVSAFIDYVANYRDEEGNALSRPLQEFVVKLAKLESFDPNIKLSDVPNDFRLYLLSALRELVKQLPADVPTRRQTVAQTEEQDTFDYSKEW